MLDPKPVDEALPNPNEDCEGPADAPNAGELGVGVELPKALFFPKPAALDIPALLPNAGAADAAPLPPNAGALEATFATALPKSAFFPSPNEGCPAAAPNAGGCWLFAGVPPPKPVVPKPVFPPNAGVAVVPLPPKAGALPFVFMFVDAPNAGEFGVDCPNVGVAFPKPFFPKVTALGPAPPNPGTLAVAPVLPPNAGRPEVAAAFLSPNAGAAPELDPNVGAAPELDPNVGAP